MSLINDTLQSDKARAAAMALLNLQDIKNQLAADETRGNSLKGAIKSAAAQDNFNYSELAELVEIDKRTGYNSNRLPLLKQDLEILKSEITNPDYQAEIQAAIDSI